MKTWRLASNSLFGNDTRQDLESKGFTVLGEYNDYYEVIPPDGWSMEPFTDFWTDILDSENKIQAVQLMRSPELVQQGDSEVYLVIHQEQ